MRQLFQISFFLGCFAILCMGTLFAVSDVFIDTQTLPKWYAFAFGLSLVLAAIALLGRKEMHSTNRQLQILLSIMVAGCMAQAVYGILQFFHILPAFENLRVTGSFDNPAGLAAALCAGLPFAICLLIDSRKWVRYIAAVAAFVIVTAVFLSYSRAGIISLSVIAVLWTFSRVRNKTIYRRTLLILLPVLLVGLYFVKRDSADGRLLIWRCSLEMVADKPIFGYGPGGFAAHYMEYQADYFREHPDSPYAQLADTVRFPFNEYLLVAVNYGLFGLAVLAVLGYFVFRRYRKQDTKGPTVRAAGCCLVSIGTFALFSYPLFYPFVWVAGLLSVWIIYGLKTPSGRIARCVLLLLSIGVVGLTVHSLRHQLLWRRISSEAMMGNMISALPDYQFLQNRLGYNQYFLYNYAYELSEIGEYDRSLVIAEKCSQIWADYHLQLIMADTHLKMERYCDAEQHFRQAAAMCPARFMPLYKLATIYQVTGRTDEARDLAQRILDKEMKVPSSVVYQARDAAAGR